jgi:hypothetical protein
MRLKTLESPDFLVLGLLLTRASPMQFHFLLLFFNQPAEQLTCSLLTHNSSRRAVSTCAPRLDLETVNSPSSRLRLPFDQLSLHSRWTRDQVDDKRSGIASFLFQGIVGKARRQDRTTAQLIESQLRTRRCLSLRSFPRTELKFLAIALFRGRLQFVSAGGGNDDNGRA